MVALRNDNQAVETGHLLAGLLRTDDNIISYALKKVNANTKLIDSVLENVLKSYPKVSGSGQSYLSPDAQKVVAKAPNCPLT